MAIKKYSVGMIGCGDIWNKGHWPEAFAHLGDVIRVKYTYDIDAEKAQAAADKSGAEVASDVDKLFDDPEIDIITRRSRRSQADTCGSGGTVNGPILSKECPNRL